MIDVLAERYRIFLVGWTDLARRGAVAVVLLSIVLSGWTLHYLSENVQISTDTTDMLSKDLPFRQKDREMEAAFPNEGGSIVVVIDGATPDLADDAALALSARLKMHPELFGKVLDPASEPFFQHNGLLYLGIDELAELGDRLAESQPFLAALWREPDLNGLFRMLGLAVEEAAKPNGEAVVDITPILNSISDVAEAQAQGAFKHLSWRQLLNGGEIDSSDYRRFLLIEPRLDYGSLQPASDAIDGVRELAREMKFDGTAGVKVRLTGSAALSQEELESVQEGMGLAGIISLTLVMIILLGGMRSLRLTVAILITLIIGLIWTAGFAIFALGTLNLISVAFAVLFIGLSVDFGIHYGLRYQEGIRAGDPHDVALAKASRGVGGALTLCALSAASAFYAFLPTDYVGLAELGLIAGTGMFIALFANITLLPALLTLFPLKAGQVDVEASVSGTIPFTWRYSRLICGLALVAALGAAVLSLRVDFDFDPLNLKDRNTESVATLFDMMDDSRTNPYSIEILSPSLEHADGLAAELEKLAEVKEVTTLSNYVPMDQDEKLDTIMSMGLFLSPAFTEGRGEAALSANQRIDALMRLAAMLGRLGSGTSDLSKAAKRLSDALTSVDQAQYPELETRLLSGLPGRLDALKLSLEAAPVELEDIPDSIAATKRAKDGRAVIDVYPRDDLRDRVRLEQFVNAVREVAPGAIGSPVIILEAGRAVLGAFQEAALIAISLIALMLIVILANLRDILLVFAPLLLSALLTLAATVVFGLSFNFANVIVLPLLFGLGVAGSIHLVIRERMSGKAGGGLETSTPRAVILSALTTIGSFGSIALSSHPGTASMGLLLTIAISLTLVSTLVVLPALMAVTRVRE